MQPLGCTHAQMQVYYLHTCSKKGKTMHREAIRLIRQTKIDSIEGDLLRWTQQRTECADEGSRKNCEEQISYLQNDLQRLMSA